MKVRSVKSSLIAVLIAGWAGSVSADKPARLPSAGPVFLPAPRDASLAVGRAVLKGYVDRFNAAYPEKLVNAVSDADAYQFLDANIPLFECPDKVMEEIYYFRWWTYRKHIKRTPAGFVVTEFLPGVGWAKAHNTINCPLGHQIYEGRWLRDPKFMDDYIAFHFGKGGDAGGGSKGYSNWLSDAVYARYMVNHDRDFVTAQLDGLIANHEAYSKGDAGMSKSRLVADVGLYWQIDSWDGMEHSIGGTGIRPTISGYLYGSAKAIARIAKLAHREDVAKRFQAEADSLKQQIQRKLWDPEMKFFKVLRYKGATSNYTNSALEDCPDGRLVKVRELIGYIPWYFNLPEDGKGYEEAWKQLVDPRGFKAPYGPCFAERRHAKFQINRGGCEWRGASWPYATSQTLTAMANLLNNYRQQAVGKKEYFDTLKCYAASHYFTKPDGSKVAWIDESLDPDTGRWITNDGGYPETRGRYYNHSSFCDLIITGLVGLRPRPDDIVEVNPLVPEGTWDWFKLDNIAYQGRTLTILWDKTGERYHQGKGLRVFADGRLLTSSDTLQRMKVSLEQVDAAPERAHDGVLEKSHVKTFIDYPVVLPGINNLEDPVISYSGGLYHIVVNSWTARKAYHLTSKDGKHNWVNRGLAFDPTTDCTRYTDGTVNHWHKFERPGVFMENGHVTAVTLAVTDTPKKSQWGNDGHGSKVIVVPFDGVALDRDLQNAPDKPPPAAAGEPAKLPPIEPLLDHAMRDVSICLGPDRTYYMTGTTGDNPAPGHDKTGWWYVNEGIRVWKSKDLQSWEPLGLVWSLDRDATWGRQFRMNGNAKARAVWAPEIHYIKGTFWLTYCMNYGGCGLLKSTGGQAEGPYVDVKKDGPLTGEIDPSLFQDDDGKVYFLWQNGKIARMNDDMTGVAEQPRLLKPSNFGHVGHEGAFLTKRNGKYHLICAEWIDGYSCMAAEADNVYGPYGPRYLAVPHGGHNVFFADAAGNWWSTIWGNDGGVAFRERPAILRIDFDKRGHVHPMLPSLERRPFWIATPPRKTSPGCMFVGTGKVELAAPADGVGIVYTRDGSTPTAQSTAYREPIEVTRDTVVKARAIWPGGGLSRAVEFPMIEARLGRPLIMNPGFEIAAQHWSCNSEVLVDSALEMDNDGVRYSPHGGNKHFRLQGGREQTITLVQAVALPAGDYELSMWVMSRASADHNLGPNLTFELLRGDGQVVKPADASSPDYLSPKGVYVQWTRRYTGLKTGNYTVKVSAGPTGAPQQGKQGWVDDFGLLQR